MILNIINLQIQRVQLLKGKNNSRKISKNDKKIFLIFILFII